MMKKALIFTVAASLLLLPACGKTDQGKPQQQTTQQAKQEQSNVQQKHTAAYKKLEEEFNKEKPDFQVVRTTYEKEIRPQVQAKYGEIDQLIDTYINAGQKGEAKADEVKQVVLKSLQRFFYEEIKVALKETIPASIDNPEKAKATLAQVKVYYDEVLKETAEKRDKAFNTTMAGEIDSAFAEAEKAILAKDQAGFALQKQVIDKTLIRVFYLAVTHYSHEVKEAVEKEPEHAKAEQLEGYAFYQSIKESLSKGDAKAAEEIDMAFRPDQDPKKVDEKKIKKAFIQAFAGKIDHYLGEALGEAWNDRNHATEEAFEGVMFLKAIELDMEKALGKAKKEETFQAATRFVEAVKKGDKASAEKEAKAILDAVGKTKAFFAK